MGLAVFLILAITVGFILLALTVFTYYSRCIILVVRYMRAAHPGNDMLIFLYIVLAILTGVVAVYLAKCEYEALSGK